MVREMDFVDEYYADKDLSLLKKLTLVIPTYNRNYYLSRCLWYHAHFPFGQIIVADSSPEEKKVVNRETVAKVREMFGADILYLEYEPETEKYGGDIYRKWGDAVMHVETEYSQICTDKEFVIPTTLNRAITFLNQNDDYLIISGGFFHVSKHNNKSFILKRYLKRCGEDSINPNKRYFNNIMKYDNGHLFSLYNSETHKSIYSKVLAHYDLDIRFGERFLEYTGYIYSKTHYIHDAEFNIRDVTHIKDNIRKNKKSESSTLRYPKIYEYDKSSETYCRSHSAFRDATMEVFSEMKSENKISNIPDYKDKIEPIMTQDSYDSSNSVNQLKRIFVQLFPNILDRRQYLMNRVKNPTQPMNIVLKHIDCKGFEEDKPII